MSESGGLYTYASASERRERLVQFVGEQGYCTIQELSQRLTVSEMTIRRDVTRLVSEGKLRGFHGGVGSLSPADLLGSDYGARDLNMGEAKRAIAARALEKMTSRSAIAIDAGTTATQLASIIPSDMQLKVITPSFPALASLVSNPGIELTCLGGDLHAESLSFAGPSTLAAISNLHIQTLFLAASGVNDRGAFCANGFDAITKRALIDVSDTVVLIADSSKFTASAMVRICAWDAIDCMIVDTGLSERDEQMLAEHGVLVEKVAPVGRPNSSEPIKSAR
jgi:DeoR/GlpR family transcriptional regulator of sugar metabolism